MMTTENIDPSNLPLATGRRYHGANDCVRQGSAIADGADAKNDAVAPLQEQISKDPVAEVRAQRVTPATELTFKRDRIKREMSAAAQEQAVREEAVRQAADKAAKSGPLAREAELQLLDCLWKAIAANSTGGIRNRRWKQSLREHPDYIPEEARKRLASFGK